MRRIPYVLTICSLAGMVTWGQTIPCMAEEIKREIPCKDGTMLIQAEVKENLEDWNKGTVSPVTPSPEKFWKMYGNEEKWEKIELEDDPSQSWKYGEELITLGIQEGYFRFEDETGISGADEIRSSETEGKYKFSSDEEAVAAAQNILEEADLQGKAQGIVTGEGKEEGEIEVRVQGMLDGKEVAYLVEGNPTAISNIGGVSFTNGRLADIWTPYQCEIKEKEKIELLSLEEILEKVESLGKKGWIGPPADGQPIIELKLSYYLEWKGEEVTFRPVWVFRTTPNHDDGFSSTGVEDFFYIDAENGKLLEQEERMRWS